MPSLLSNQINLVIEPRGYADICSVQWLFSHSFIHWQSAEAPAVYDFELTHFLCLLMLCPCIAAHPGIICGESILP